MGKNLTKRVWRLHSWLGLGCGLGLVVIGLTGSLLVFHDEIDAWRFPALHRAHPTPAGRLSYDVLWQSLRRALPDETVIGWTPAAAADQTDAIYVARAGEEDPRSLHLDPYTGEVRGTPTVIDRTLNGWLLNLHYSLLTGTFGTFVAGLLAVGLLTLGASGLWLHRRFWVNFLRLRWDRSARLFFSDLHKAVGISSAAFNLILGFTGAWWNLEAVYNKWSAAPAAATAPANPLPPSPRFDPSPGGPSLDAMLAQGQKTLPGFRPTYLALPERREGTITYYGTLPTANPLRGDYGSRLVFGAADGGLKEAVDMRRAGLWAKISDSFAVLHYGTWGAAFGPVPATLVKILWTVLGLSPGVLAVSGFLVWRSRQRRARNEIGGYTRAANI